MWLLRHSYLLKNNSRWKQNPPTQILCASSRAHRLQFLLWQVLLVFRTVPVGRDGASTIHELKCYPEVSSAHTVVHLFLYIKVLNVGYTDYAAGL